jgi:hypothetical protein
MQNTNSEMSQRNSEQLFNSYIPTVESTLEPTDRDPLEVLIFDAKLLLARFFPTSEIQMRYQIDPADGSRQQILGVKAGRTAKSYLAFEQFETNWWNANRHRANGDLVIKVDG